jgi:hypothetical protein
MSPRAVCCELEVDKQVCPRVAGVLVQSESGKAHRAQEAKEESLPLSLVCG